MRTYGLALILVLGTACGSAKVNYVATTDDTTQGDITFPDPDGLLGDLTESTEQDPDSLVDDQIGDLLPDEHEVAPDDAAEIGPDSLEELDSTDIDDAGGEIAPGDILDTDEPDAGDLTPDTQEPPEPPVQNLVAEQRPTTAPWASIELLTFSHPALSGEKFTAKTQQNDPTVAGWFGGQTSPAAGSVVLHVGPGCQSEPSSAIMLVHGAGSHADQSWIDPDLFDGGLASHWIADGHCVFAVTFPHPFGDNRNQAVQLAAALHQARVHSGLDQIHVVSHSKGGIVALVYATGFLAQSGLPYGNDMATLTLIAVPMGGMDFTFRHPAFNYPADLMGLYMPSSWNQLLQYGMWKDVLEDSIYGGAFPGVLQLTVAWDEVYSLATMEQDWYTTYYGGTGFISKSLGIAHAIDLSGNFMENLRKGKTPEQLPCYIVSGGLQSVGGVPWEYTGPSDAMVFEASATDETMLSSVAAKKHAALSNHWDLLSSSGVRDWIAEQVW